MNQLRGTFVVCITPMTPDQKIDFEAFKRNIDWFIDSGVPGVCLLGGTGEFLSLTKEERLEVVETMIPYINKRIKCIIGTAAESTQETIEYSCHAEANGADGVMIINPYYARPTREELKSHYQKVSDAINIPIMLYNNPAHTGVDMDPSLIAELSEIENVKYVKDATGDVKRLLSIQRLSNENINIFCGGEDVVYENFLLGAVGWICVCGNIIPKEATKLFELVQQGKIAEAKILYERMFPLLEILENKPSPIQQVKYAMELIGYDSGPARAPRQDLPDDLKQEVETIIRNFGL